MFPHYKYYVREVKIKAYAQLLESYRSLTLGYMADAFGVTEDYIDSELCRFIAGGRLHAKIDKVWIVLHLLWNINIFQIIS